MSTPPFDPQPCVPDDIPVPLDVNIVSPDPLAVEVSGPDPLNVAGTLTVDPNPLPVVVSPNPLPVTGTVAVSNLSEPLDVNVLTSAPLTVLGGGSAVASPTLTAATTGNGTTVDFASARSDVTLFVQVNGTVTAGVVDLQASHDGVNWVRAASSGSLTTGVNQYLGLSGEPFRWFRGVVSATVVGGGSVTATLMYG